MLLYRAEMYILTRYPTLIDLNTKNAGLSEKLNDNSQFFVIKSFSEEDVHKAIKYKVWSSTKTGNQTLSNAFKLCKEKGGEVYLFYSCNGSGRFVGVAKMTSPLDEKNSFMYWTQDSKWSGLFDIDWVFIKDTPFKAFKNIDILMKDGQVKPVTYSRDTQEIPFEEAKKMMSIIEKYINSNTILEHFEYYDLRQENYEKTLQMTGQQQQQSDTQN
jgi:YTH domain-containing family protein